MGGLLGQMGAESNIPFHVTNGVIEFTIPKVLD